MIKMQAIGRLGKDAELRQTNTNGRSVISFTIACDSGKDSTTWVSCARFVADDKASIHQYLKKGTQVFVEGQPSARPWVNNNNEAQASLEFIVYDIKLLGSASSNQVGAAQGDAVAQANAARPTVNRPAPARPTPAINQVSNEDDVPF